MRLLCTLNNIMINRFAPSTFKWGNGSSWSYGDLLRSRRGLGRFPSISLLVARLCADVFIVVSLILFPWWLTLAVSLLFFIIFNFPIEAVLAVIALDILSGGIYYAIGIIVALPLLYWLKRRVWV